MITHAIIRGVTKTKNLKGQATAILRAVLTLGHWFNQLTNTTLSENIFVWAENQDVILHFNPT